MTITDFLKANPGKYTHFVLLDHQDWLAGHAPEALAEEWEEIFANAAPGAKVLMRSAGITHDFLPEQVEARLRFRPDLTEPLHATDRVGTYGSLHFAEIL
jgi:S-adenosylmethionine-diacylglycerol 3-amino-3-carboxypropyl transferase